MKKDVRALNFSEKERICEKTFIESGPFWHIYTNGTQMQDIFCTESDKDIAMWLLARSRCKTPEVQIITFEIMDNHVHIIAAGAKDACVRLFNFYKRKLRFIFTRAGRIIDWDKFRMHLLPIENLQALRNEITYVNRNAFVSNPSHTPTSYPWGGGCAFFNIWKEYLNPIKFETITIELRRKLIHTKDISTCSSLQAIGNHVYIPSFCNIELGENIFRDNRSYFMSLARNVEAYREIAMRLKDFIFLTDEEIYSAMILHIEKEYGTKQVAILSPEQKMSTARFLHQNYNASKQQLKRMLRMEIGVLNELFPL